MPSMLDRALGWASAGIKVLPSHWITGKGVCSCGDEKCKSPGKHPLGAHGSHDATTDLAEIRRIWTANPHANFGISPGPLPDGRIWFALDCDQGMRIRKGQKVYLDGAGQLADLEEEFGEKVSRKIEQISGSGGSHLILARPANSPVPRRLASAIDMITEGKYIIAAPSNHILGTDYELVEKNWMPPGDPLDNLTEIFKHVPDAPQWLLDFDQPGKTRQRDSDPGDDGGDWARKMSRKIDGLTFEEFSEAVMAIPNPDRDYDLYMEMMFSIHFETDGSDDGFRLMEKWASQSSIFDLSDLERRWDSIFDSKDISRMKSGKNILRLAQKAGWEMPAQTEIGKAIQRINRDHAFVVVGGRHKVVYMTRSDDAISGLDFLEERTFLAKFANEKYEVPAPTKAEPEKTKEVPIGVLWWASPLRRQYIEGVAFNPDLTKSKPHVFNLFTGFAVPPSKHADPYKFCWRVVDHVYIVLADGIEAHGDWILAWMAQIVQEPENKLGTALVLGGKPGTGKSIIGDILQLILGRFVASASRHEDILSKFNSALATALLAQMEEAFWAGDKKGLEGALLHLVTSTRVRMELKGVDAIESKNYTRVLITSNNKWIVPANMDERRFASFWVSDCHMQDKPYFAKMWKQMADGGIAALHQYLLEFDWRAKGIDLRQIPNTAMLARQKLESAPPLAKFIVDLIDQEHAEIWDNAETPGVIETERLLSMVNRQANYDLKNMKCVALGHSLRDWLPDVIRFRPRKEGSRPHYYRFGTVAECRKFLNDKFGADIFEI